MIDYYVFKGVVVIISGLNVLANAEIGVMLSHQVIVTAPFRHFDCAQRGRAQDRLKLFAVGFATTLLS